ncbi:MAG TPA: hypothetical protein VGB55_08495, partial [Tepidisphaeraceae bacterium]
DLGLSTRLATMDDLPFIDALQKQHSKQLGFFPRAQLEGYVRNGWVRVVEEREFGVESLKFGINASPSTPNSKLTTQNSPVPLGYIASRDRYLKRDELGAVFQLCVVPGRQRGLIGATLLKSVFEAASYGCRLFSCWCAQDLAANYFWEAMGFSAIAFRTGSPVKGRGPKGSKTPRVHLFWQKRIRKDDVTTPWWFPSETTGGAIREGRIVLPIPPGRHWSEAMPVLLPVGRPALGEGVESSAESVSAKTPRRSSRRSPATGPVSDTTTVRTKVTAAIASSGGLRFGAVSVVGPVVTPEEPAVVARPKVKRAAVKNDPRHIAAARELRDRWLDELNAKPPSIDAAKYDVTRKIGESGAAGASLIPMPMRQIAEAA